MKQSCSSSSFKKKQPLYTLEIGKIAYHSYWLCFNNQGCVRMVSEKVLAERLQDLALLAAWNSIWGDRGWHCR